MMSCSQSSAITSVSNVIITDGKNDQTPNDKEEFSFNLSPPALFDNDRLHCQLHLSH